MALTNQQHLTLHEGKPLAAKITLEKQGWYAFVLVEPIMRSGITHRQQVEIWSRTREADRPYDDTIQCYHVRYTELSEWHLQEEWALDMDIAMQQRPVTDWIVELPDEETLIRVLGKLLPALSELQLPQSVEYPWPPTNFTRRISLAEL